MYIVAQTQSLPFKPNIDLMSHNIVLRKVLRKVLSVIVSKSVEGICTSHQVPTSVSNRTIPAVLCSIQDRGPSERVSKTINRLEQSGTKPEICNLIAFLEP